MSSSRLSPLLAPTTCSPRHKQVACGPRRVMKDRPWAEVRQDPPADWPLLLGQRAGQGDVRLIRKLQEAAEICLLHLICHFLGLLQGGAEADAVAGCGSCSACLVAANGAAVSLVSFSMTGWPARNNHLCL